MSFHCPSTSFVFIAFFQINNCYYQYSFPFPVSHSTLSFSSKYFFIYCSYFTMNCFYKWRWFFYRIIKNGLPKVIRLCFPSKLTTKLLSGCFSKYSVHLWLANVFLLLLAENKTPSYSQTPIFDLNCLTPIFDHGYVFLYNDRNSIVHPFYQ